MALNTMTWLAIRRHLSPTSLIQLLCTSLTVFLIHQELVTFLITRPTTTSSEEQGLDHSTFPEVSVCLEPAFSAAAAEKYGYDINNYYRGAVAGQRSGRGKVGGIGIDLKLSTFYQNLSILF